MNAARVEKYRNGVTVAHQWLTLIAVPALLAIAGWIALTFNGLQLDVAGMKVDIGYMKSDLSHNTARLDEISRELKEP